MRFRWSEALLISGMRRNRISSSSVMMVGQDWNLPSALGRVAGGSRLCCVMFIVAPLSFFCRTSAANDGGCRKRTMDCLRRLVQLPRPRYESHVSWFPNGPVDNSPYASEGGVRETSAHQVQTKARQIQNQYQQWHTGYSRQRRGGRRTPPMSS